MMEGDDRGDLAAAGISADSPGEAEDLGGPERFARYARSPDAARRVDGKVEKPDRADDLVCDIAARWIEPREVPDESPALRIDRLAADPVRAEAGPPTGGPEALHGEGRAERDRRVRGGVEVDRADRRVCNAADRKQDTRRVAEAITRVAQWGIGLAGQLQPAKNIPVRRVEHGDMSSLGDPDVPAVPGDERETLDGPLGSEPERDLADAGPVDLVQASCEGDPVRVTGGVLAVRVAVEAHCPSDFECVWVDRGGCSRRPVQHPDLVSVCVDVSGREPEWHIADRSRRVRVEDGDRGAGQ